MEIGEHSSQVNMEVERTRKKILNILNSYPAMIVLAVLIAFDCFDLVAEIMIEQEIRETMVEDSARIQNFVLKLKHGNHFGPEITSSIDHVIIAINDVLKVYKVIIRGDETSCDNCTLGGLFHHRSTVFSLSLLSDDDTVYCGIPSDIDHLDIHEVSIRTDKSLQRAVYGLKIFGLINILFMSLETVVRIVCTGKTFFKKKIEVFDAFVVFTSLILDCVFYNGEFKSSSTIILLLLPWRIIRMFNSLIGAVSNKQNIQIKNLRADKKKMEEKQAKMKRNLLDVKGNQDRLAELCKSRGATYKEISSCIYERKPQMTLAAISTVASMMLISTPLMETTGNGYTTDVINNVIDPSSTKADPNNNNIKSALSIPCQPRRRSISTPNLLRNTSIPYKYTSYLIPGTKLVLPFLLMAPLQTQQEDTFPSAVFDNQDFQERRLSVQTPSVPGDIQQIGFQERRLSVQTPSVTSDLQQLGFQERRLSVQTPSVPGDIQQFGFQERRLSVQTPPVTSDVQQFGFQERRLSVQTPPVTSDVQQLGFQERRLSVQTPPVTSDVQQLGFQERRLSVQSLSVTSDVQQFGFQERRLSVQTPPVHSDVQQLGFQERRPSVQIPSVISDVQQFGSRERRLSVHTPSVTSDVQQLGFQEMRLSAQTPPVTNDIQQLGFQERRHSVQTLPVTNDMQQLGFQERRLSVQTPPVTNDVQQLGFQERRLSVQTLPVTNDMQQLGFQEMRLSAQTPPVTNDIQQLGFQERQLFVQTPPVTNDMQQLGCQEMRLSVQIPPVTNDVQQLGCQERRLSVQTPPVTNDIQQLGFQESWMSVQTPPVTNDVQQLGCQERRLSVQTPPVTNDIQQLGFQERQLFVQTPPVTNDIQQLGCQESWMSVHTPPLTGNIQQVKEMPEINITDH